MGRLAKILVIAAVIFSVPALASTTETEKPEPILLIVEFMTGSQESAGDEFVEIVNESDELIPAKDMRLQYKSASGTDWVTKAALEGQLQPRGRYLVATGGIETAADTVRASLGLAGSGGHLRLVKNDDSEDVEYDQIAWGDATSAQTEPMPAPDKGQSMKRLVDEDGLFIDTDNDIADFALSFTPTPQRSEPLPEVDQGGNPQTGTPKKRNYSATGVAASTDSTGGRSGPFAPLQITELMPDPDKPLTDAEDEYIELFNPHEEPVDLEEYVLETGMQYSYRFTLPNLSIGPGEYLALYSLDTNLTLSNSEGRARLLDPAGDVLFEVPVYQDAKPDTAWAIIGEVWQWTTQPTPGESNVAAEDNGESASLSGEGRGGLTAGSRQLAGNERNIYEEPPAADSDSVDTAVVAGVGSLALLYAGYEYRFDIGNRFHQLRRYLASRRGGG